MNKLVTHRHEEKNATLSLYKMKKQHLCDLEEKLYK